MNRRNFRHRLTDTAQTLLCSNIVHCNRVIKMLVPSIGTMCIAALLE